MELSWSTFILEIINFLVLVWILKRFLYRPVLNVLEKRRQAIAQTLEDAEDQKTQATALEQQYQGRIKTWEQEKQQARDALKQELLNEKNRLLQQLQQELDNERQKAQVLNTRQQTEVLQQYQHTAHQQAAKFAGKLLQSVASPEMEVRLFDLFMTQIANLEDEHITSLRNAFSQDNHIISVSSAYALSASQKQQLEQALAGLLEHPVTIHYEQQPELLAGLRITIGSWLLRLNLQDELSGFAELSHDKTIA